MKKIFVLLFALMSGIVSFAQSLEVRGVETKVVIYDGPEYSGWKYPGTGPEQYSTKWFGYSFYNMNSIPVSVDAELYCVEYGREKLVSTKAFNLKSKETYVWKMENKRDFMVNYDTAGSHGDWSDEGRSTPGLQGRTYYVKYKAYKIL